MSQARSELARAIHARFGVEPRPFQLDLVQRTLGGASSLGIMPTGSGKSLAFQAAAALMPGTVLVISPLVSLMRDQVEKLRGLLRVARLDSTLPLEEARETLRALTAGQLDLLYVAPERLANERFQSALGRTRVAVLAVDEAHIRASLAIPVDGVINTGARRPNLILRVEAPLNRERRLLELAMARPEAPTIVYALRQADTEALAQVLDGAGVRAAAYHAGLSPEERASVQDRFLRDDLACVVATIAFGMGVDKPNVRRVFHLHAPRSLEGYIQEVGRAGRDGAPAEIALLYAEDDIAALANFVDAKVPSEERVRAALNAAFAARESADVLAFSPQTIGDQHDLDPAAVRTLFARLELRGVVRAITPAFDTYQLPIDHDAVGAAARLGEPDGTRWRALVANARRGRTWLTLSVSEHSAAAGLSLEAARRLLWRLEEEGLAPARASGVLQRYRVLRRPDRATDGPALLESVRQGVEAEHRRLEAVRAYVLERGCRQSHALAYLGDADTSACGTCDLCQGAAPIEPEALRRWDWRSEFDASVVDSLAEIETDPVGISRALCQVSTPRSRLYRRHPAWGTLERAPYADVLSLVECRIKGLVSAESKP